MKSIRALIQLVIGYGVAALLTIMHMQSRVCIHNPTVKLFARHNCKWIRWSVQWYDTKNGYLYYFLDLTLEFYVL